ncbi:PAS-domain containing protein [uncultured Tateyamaria sp.]|uniref:PAS-domain containing protein n=1 Tax=uncultured Tateyamaria sp. TaxID=455651 RepID=UPI00263887F6|nr:PAS-domain containing protein [uncultured Tateyamaria sp.]
MPVVEIIVAFVCAATAVGMGLVFLGARRTSEIAMAQPGPQGMHFLFCDLDLEHATDQARAVLFKESGETDWHALRAALTARFPGLPDADALRTLDSLTLHSAALDDTAILHLDREREMTRVVIKDESVTDATAVHEIKSIEAELGTLRLAAAASPYPIWLVGADETIQWHNTAYATLSEAAQPEQDSVNKPLFELDQDLLDEKQTIRVPVKIASTGTTEWYNVTATRVTGNIIYHAIDINAVIEAEVAQRNFVQTLAKTFAHLSIGLAIFDRNGQLALFNPAMVDLTSLPVEFLSGRPDLLAFFDRLRDNRVMPEPKNYSSWRQEISDMIAAATHASYQETWTLNTGHTYRVSGRPHPDGAVAFLIEDITAEISLTRNFRAELELGQSLMDTFEDALAVFSSAGVLTFCNIAFREMWKMDPDCSFADVTIVDSIKEWQSQTAPNPAWGDMREFVMKLSERAPWEADIIHHTEGPFTVRLSPIASGATVVRFTQNIPLPARATQVKA